MRRIIKTGALLVALEALLVSGCGDDGGPYVSYNDGAPPDGPGYAYNDGSLPDAQVADASEQDGGDTADAAAVADASDER